MGLRSVQFPAKPACTGKKALNEARNSALENVGYKTLPVKEYHRLLDGERQRRNSLWTWDSNVKAIRWDSIKTDALVKKLIRKEPKWCVTA